MTDRAPPSAPRAPSAPPGTPARPWRVALVLLTALGSAWLSVVATPADAQSPERSEEHTSELQSQR